MSAERKASLIHLLPLILAGEAVFFLPFIVPRVFRPTLMAVLDIDNLTLGTYFSIYGLVAIAAYGLGGPLADRFPPHRLLSAALISTSLGGLLMLLLPSNLIMRGLYGYWGLTTILLFWAGMLRTTRLVGGSGRQGIAFGLLDGGRGLFGALVGSAAVYLLSTYMPEEASMEQRVEGFKAVILFFSAVVFLIGLLVYRSLSRIPPAPKEHQARNMKDISILWRSPVVWLQGGIILCAYSGYKISDDFSLMAQDLLGYNEVEAATVGSLGLWIRPFAAIAFGLLADRFRTSWMLLPCFLLMLLAGLVVGLGVYEAFLPVSIFLSIISSGLGIYALRGLYFAIMEETKIPLGVTGSAVGLASMLGYLPDVYMGPWMGYLLDRSPGATGHEDVFLLLAGFAGLGLLFSLLFLRAIRTR